jgi:hypothetical protein
VSGSSVRELLKDLEAIDGAPRIRRIKANDESVEALFKVVTQKEMVLKDLLLALEEDFASVKKAAKRERPHSRRANLRGLTLSACSRVNPARRSHSAWSVSSSCWVWLSYHYTSDATRR